MVSAKGYDDLIMDHIKNARNFHALDGATHKASGSNPLCGDELAVYLKIDGDRIENVAFQCTCCGISMASSSIMTESVEGKSVAEAKALLLTMTGEINAGGSPSSHEGEPWRRAILETVREFPARTRCAVLPWVTLGAALDNRQETVFVA
jgi:nitrogen fixation protein NifU and related proteins